VYDHDGDGDDNDAVVPHGGDATMTTTFILLVDS
jgi:hypothetical protein